jgi:hypothetical protein
MKHLTPQHLTPKELLQLAPGAAPRKNAKKERLLDTSKWVAWAATEGYHPVIAMQGTTHEDAGHDPRDGRHLVVCGAADGHAVALLNSHDRLMRVWVGRGFWLGGELLLASVSPRRRTDESPLHLDIVDLPGAYLFDRHEVVRKIVDTGYIKGRLKPSWKAVDARLRLPERPQSWLVASDVVRVLSEGNIEPSTHKNTRRNVKGIRRPDAYWHLAQAAWRAIL